MARSLHSIDILRQRCTPFALEFLLDLERHPLLDQVVNRLLEIDGMISRQDVEEAFFELIVREPDNE